MSHKSTFLGQQILKIAKLATDESSESAVKQIRRIVYSVTDAKKCINPPIGCGKPVTGLRDDQSAKEYRMSGLCQSCQDVFFDDGSAA